MADTIYGLFICMILVNVCDCEVILYKDGDKRYTWMEANNKCKSMNGYLTAEITSLKDSNLHSLEPSSIWIGKTRQLSVWMEIVGCYRMASTDVFDVETIANCERMCHGFEYFAHKYLPFEGCQCIQTLPQSQTGFASYCQNRNGFKYMTVYKRYSGPTDRSNKQGNCMRNSCTPPSHLNAPTVVECSQAGVAHGVCDDGSIINDWNLSWNESLNSCVQLHNVYFIDNFTANCAYVSAESWTRYFREEFTVTKNEYNEFNTTPIRCAYISSISMVQKWSKCNNTLSYILCKVTNSTYKPSTALTHHIERHSIISPSISTVSDGRPTKQKTQTSTSITPLTASNTGLVVGSVIGCISAIVLTVVVILLVYKKRNNIAKNKRRKDTEFSNMTYREEQKSYGIKNDDSFDNANISNKLNTEPIYAQVKKSKGKQNASDCVMEQTYAESSYDVYDHLNETNKRKNHSNELLYDSNIGTRSDVDPTYHTTDATRSASHDIYDHSFKTRHGNSDYDISTSNEPEEYDYV